MALPITVKWLQRQTPHASLICYLIVLFSGFPDSKILFRVSELRMISVAGNVWGDGLRSMYGPYTSCGQRILRAVVWRARSILGISYQGPTMPVVQTKRNEITKWEVRIENDTGSLQSGLNLCFRFQYFPGFGSYLLGCSNSIFRCSFHESRMPQSVRNS